MNNPVDLRPSLTAYLHQQLGAFGEGFRHNLALVGPRGSGKSALLQHALSTAPQGLSLVSCSLQRGSMREFLTGFGMAILRGALGAGPEVSGRALLQSASTVVPKTAAAIQRLEHDAAGHHPTEAFTRALDVIPLLCQERQRPCVLVFDEFLFLEDLGLSHVFQELGKRVMTWPSTLFWVTSSSMWRARDILRERLHLLFGQFELLTLEAVEDAAARTWIQQELPAATPTQRAAMTRFLLQWIGNSPWYLGVMLKRMRETARLTPRTRVAPETSFGHAAWDVLGSPDGVLHQWCTARIERLMTQRHGVLARDALLAIAGGARTPQAIAQRYRSRRHLSAILQLLLEQDLVQRKGICWVIPDQLFTFWLNVVHGPRLQQGVMDHDVAEQGFTNALRAIWTSWSAASQQSFVTRLYHLLAQFRNETVCLDSKTGRLPAFTAMHTHHVSQGVTCIVAEGQGSRWCYLVHEGKLEELEVAAFEQFCKGQSPKPSRKVVVAQHGVDLNAKLLAKATNMWVWEPEEVNVLCRLYEQPPIRGAGASEAIDAALPTSRRVLPLVEGATR